MIPKKAKIVVVDGADGLTPDMLRKRKRKTKPVPEAKEWDRELRAQYE